MIQAERRKRLIEMIIKKLDSKYVTTSMLERIYKIIYNV